MRTQSGSKMLLGKTAKLVLLVVSGVIAGDSARIYAEEKSGAVEFGVTAKPIPFPDLAPQLMATCPMEPLIEKAIGLAQSRFSNPLMWSIWIKNFYGVPSISFHFHPKDGPQRYEGYVEVSQAYSVDLNCS